MVRGEDLICLFFFLKNLYENKPIKIHNFGIHKRDFSNIDLIVDGIFKVFKDKNKQIRRKPLKLTPDCGEGPFNIYNLATGKPQPLMKFIKIIEKLLVKNLKRLLWPCNQEISKLFQQIHPNLILSSS